MHERADNKYLLIRLSQNDQEAFKALFNRYCHKVNSFALKLTHSAILAEEIVQDVFMKVWLNRKSLASIEYFPSYLYTIARNHILNVLKRQVLEENAKVVFQREILPGYQTEERELYDHRKEILHQVISRMPAQQRTIYCLCHQKGLKYEEVAERLNISRLTVKTHMQHALRTIRSHFSSILNTVSVLLFSVL